MNGGRIVLGGLVAGLVMNVVDAAVNGMLLGARWNAEANALSPGLPERMGALSTAGWIVFDFVMGILIAWTYASIRPRYGPGPRAALTAGLMAWLYTHIAFSSLWFMGMFSLGLVGASTAGGLVAGLLGGWVAGALYKEA